MKDIIGKRYGKLVVLSLSGRNDKGRYVWECLCDCGNKIISSSQYLGSRKNSCGCLVGKKGTHGMGKTRTYKIWSCMLQRVSNKNSSAWKYYGGRGIKVCDDWIKFENFFRDMGEANKNQSIDRIDNEGDYCPENCRWVSLKVQARNKRNNRIIKYKGKSLCISEWAEIYSIKVATLWARLVKGMEPPECFLPVGEIPRGGAARKSQQSTNRMIDSSHR